MGFNKTTPAAAPAAAPTATAPVAAAPAAETPKAAAPADSGAAAAIERLKKTAPPPAPKNSGGRDFDAEARGKTRCVQFQAALASPAIAGMKFDTMEQYLELCRQAADFGTDYTFGDLKK